MMFRLLPRVAGLLAVVLALISPAVCRADAVDDAWSLAESTVCEANAAVSGLSRRPWAPMYEQLRLTAVSTLWGAENDLSIAADWIVTRNQARSDYDDAMKAGNFKMANFYASMRTYAEGQALFHCQAATEQAKGAISCVKAALSLIGQ